MNIEEYREYCLHLKGTSEECPFGPEHIVFKVMGKIFTICSIDDFGVISLKCDPEYAIELREKYQQINPGFHLNKKHWNSVELEGLSNKFIKELIRHSYDQVVLGLTKKQKAELIN